MELFQKGKPRGRTAVEAENVQRRLDSEERLIVSGSTPYGNSLAANLLVAGWRWWAGSALF